MRVQLIALLLCASGCEKIPGTDAHLIKEAEKSAADQLIDPTAAMFRNETVHRGAVCGEINGKNRMGAYVGFSRYLYIKGGGASLDPQADPNDAASAEDFCNSVRSSGYSSASLIQSSCQRAADEQMKQFLQNSFDTLWKNTCEK